MRVYIKEVKGTLQKKRFVFLPEKLYADSYPRWVPPIYKNVINSLDSRKNDTWDFCSGKLYLTHNGDSITGRILVLINHRANEFLKKKEARFGYFDSINNSDVASTLLGKAEEWARSKGCNRIVGPMVFSDLNPSGMLIEGFEEQSSIGTWWHPPYAKELLRNAGYVKEIDWVSYVLDLTRPRPSIYKKIAERVLTRTRFKLVEFENKRKIRPYLRGMFNLSNRAHLHLYGFSPMSDGQMKKSADSYLKILDPRFLKIITLDGELIAFCIGIPDMTSGIRAARGRLFPFGLFKISEARKKSNRLDMIAGAIEPEHRGKGLDVLMTDAIYSSAAKAGLTCCDSRLVLENNLKMRAEYEKAGAKVYKRYRLFAKKL